MTIEEVKKTAFLSICIEEWWKAVEKTVSENEIHSLLKQTYEGIELSPLYTKKNIENQAIDQLPGEETYRRGFQKGKLAADWKIAQKLNANNWNDLKNKLEKVFKNGQDAISLEINEVADIESVNFRDLTEIVNLSAVPIFIMTNAHHQSIVEKLTSLNEDIFGVMGTDHISSRLSEGYMFEADDPNWGKWEKVISSLNKFPDLKTILVDTTPYHMAGANAVQELAIALAEAVFYIELLKKNDWEPNQIVDKIAFHFSVGPQFFMEVAKLRAFRVLWQTVATAYGLNGSKIVISAETSEFTKTVLDPYVNILRASNEAFAAVLGGIDYLHITPYDKMISSPTSFADRIARSTQLILKDEAYLNKVTDPAGGSYYIESLTNQLVSQAWELFQEIDRQGGIIKSLKIGWIQEKIKQTLARKIEDVQSGKTSIIGVNVYQQRGEKQSQPQQSKEKVIPGGKKIEPLPKTRLTETIENIILNQRMGDMKHGE